MAGIVQGVGRGGRPKDIRATPTGELATAATNVDATDIPHAMLLELRAIRIGIQMLLNQGLPGSCLEGELIELAQDEE